MNILLIFPGFIIAFIIVLYYERKIRRTEPRNKVHFYVARDKIGDVIPKMTSLNDGAKAILGTVGDCQIHYRNQCLIVKQHPSSTVATNYVPDWTVTSKRIEWCYDTLKHNSRTLKELREECDVIQRKRQSPR